MSSISTLTTPGHPWPTPKLPTEIWEYVIDLFVEERLENANKWNNFWRWQSDLLPLALVCRTWLPRTRKYLFMAITLSTSRRIERFLGTLSSCPRYGRFVKILALDGLLDGNEKVEFCQWIHKALFTLPQLLPNLQSLTLDRLPVLHPSHIMLISRFKSVRSLTLGYLPNQSACEVLQLMNRFPNLHKLMLWINYGTRRPRGPHCKAKQELTHLTLKFRCFSQHSNELLSFSNLKSSMIDFPIPELSKILQGCSQSLRQLHLPIPEGADWGT